MTSSDGLGRLTISPSTGKVGTWGTWTASLSVGPAGISAGGVLRVALPVRWHQWHRNSSRRVQTIDPTEAFYVSARCSRPDVTLRCEMEDRDDAEFGKSHRMNLGGTKPASRYGWTVRVTVGGGGLVEGDTVDVRFGDTSAGGRGFTPPIAAGSPEPVHAAVDPTGDGDFTILPEEDLPLLSHTPADAEELLLVLPSISQAGDAIELRMVALDRFFNPVPLPDTAVNLVVVEGDAHIDDTAPKLGGPRSWGHSSVSVTPTRPGVLRIRGTSDDGILYTTSNPSRVAVDTPDEGIYWGDLHSHTHYSHDGTGTGDDHFRYARDVAMLDLYAASDHNDVKSMSPDQYRDNIEFTEAWNEPRRFATIFGFEASYKKPYGHHNVYYPSAEGRYYNLEEITLEGIWAEGTPGEMITVPHHTGGFGRPGGGVTHDWSIDDPRFRTTSEIYSSHGHSEEYAPNHPLSMDVTDFTFQGPGDPGNYIQDAWLAGLKMGVIASSDNHNSQPGVEGFGVVAVKAAKLSRRAIFEAIRDRRTYGATGSRIILDFSINGHDMGSDFTVPAGTPADVHVEVIGTGPLRWIELLRADLDRPDDGFSVVHREWFPGFDNSSGRSAPSQFAFDWTDGSPPSRGIYYVRTRQRDFVHGRVAEAWSSPIWTNVS